MQAFAVLVSEDNDINIKECNLAGKHVVVMAQVPPGAEKKDLQNQIAIGVAPVTRNETFVNIPSNALWFPDLGMAASYLKNIVDDPKLAETLKLKPLTSASGVVMLNVFPEPIIHDGMLDIQMHVYPHRYVPLTELIPAMVKAGVVPPEFKEGEAELDGTSANVTPITAARPVTAETVTVDAEVKDVNHNS